MGVATCYINIFIASILDHTCTVFFIHTLYTDVVLYAQQKKSDRDGIPAAVGCLIFHRTSRQKYRLRAAPAPSVSREMYSCAGSSVLRKIFSILSKTLQKRGLA